MVQNFKGDTVELKMEAVGAAPATAIELALNQYFDGIYGCIPLGEFLYDQNRVPLANAIKREVFIQCFQELFEAFAVAGTFPSYITVFKKIFGEDVQIDFVYQGTVTGLAEYGWIYDEDDDFIVDHLGDTIYLGETFAAGRLKINVESSTLTQFTALADELLNEEYIFHELVDEVGDNLVFTGLLGIENESELLGVINVLVPIGIYTEVTLSLI